MDRKLNNFYWACIRLGRYLTELSEARQDERLKNVAALIVAVSSDLKVLPTIKPKTPLSPRNYFLKTAGQILGTLEGTENESLEPVIAMLILEIGNNIEDTFEPRVN